MPQSSSLINKNITTERHQYLYTTMVSHRGTPISFAMREKDGYIFYSVLDLSDAEQNANTIKNNDKNNDKNYWSKVNFEGEGASWLRFPSEIMQVGYSLVPNFLIDKYDSTNQKIVQGYSLDGKPLDKNGIELSETAIKDKTDFFYSSTARLGAIKPFQVLSDGKYIYIFRQSIPRDNSRKEASAVVDNTLLVDRFILSGTMLKLSREIRYQRSRHKTEPESRKDTLSAVDVEGNPFYEPTRELVFADNLSDGNFSVLLLPGGDAEEQRWQIFTTDTVTGKINSFNIRFDYSTIFDTSDSQFFLEQFIERYGLDTSLIEDVQVQIRDGKKDDEIAEVLLSSSPYSEKDIPEDALCEAVYTIRTGVIKDDFILESTSTWPLIEYDENGDIKSNYLKDGVLIEDYQFHGVNNTLKPHASAYTPKHGLSSCYYYQQEIGPDGKPMKNKACVMLAAGLEDKEKNKYIGILNFSAANSGHLSCLTTNKINMPDINVQALDENPYATLEHFPKNDDNRVVWQQPQKMRLLDIDPNGLSTSGGVLKFAYTSAAIGKSQGYSDAVEATEPYLFDDSLGRVNLYFKGKSDNFFVLYFNPTGSKSIQVADSTQQAANPPLSLNPRLDRDVNINVVATLPDDGSSNTCTITMRSQPDNEVVEEWNHLPRRYSQISSILNGNNALPLGTLEPLGNTDDPRAAYVKPSTGNGSLRLRTRTDNNLLFQGESTYGSELADGNPYSLTLKKLSTFLANNTRLSMAEKSFSVIGNARSKNVTLKADLFYQSYLSSMVIDPEDSNKLWGYLKDKGLIQAVSELPDRAYLSTLPMTGTLADLSNTLADGEIDGLGLELLKEGNAGDRKARRARLKQSLMALMMDVAQVRIVTLTVQDTNTQSIDRLEAGLKAQVLYDYNSNFVCKPANLSGVSAPEWEHFRSYLFNSEVNYDANTDATTEIRSGFDYQYQIDNAIGQWEDWEASLALEFSPKSATQGALLSANVEEENNLKALRPTQKGLSVEAWVKPSKMLNNPGTVLYYEQGDQSYSLGIKRDSDNSSQYKCVATLGGKEYASKKSFSFEESKDNEQWRHLAFTHRKYWGYELKKENSISCGNDSSLQLIDEFTLEVLVKLDSAGTLLEKANEYSLAINSYNEVVFGWAGKNCLEEWIEISNPTSIQQRNDTRNYENINGLWHERNRPGSLDQLGQFYKITLIRSRNKPQTDPTKMEYPITGDNQKTETGSDAGGKKWYEDKKQEDIIKGMAEKQHQLESTMKLSQANMFGMPPGQSFDANPKYHHTLVVAKSENDATIWTNNKPTEVARVEAFQDLIIGGGGFTGTFTSVRIWNRALSLSEAKGFSLPENKTGLLSHWRITEGKGTYLYDNVSENHGVANGGIWVDSPQTNRAGQFQFYVDGSPEAHDTPTNSSAQGIDQFSIGGIKKANGSANHFKGTLEEIRIWNLPRTNEQITDNAFGRLNGEWEQLLANYTFDKPRKQTDSKVQDASVNSIHLTVHQESMVKEVLSTAPIATEIPQVRSALTGVLTEYNGTLLSRPAVVEYGDVQKNDDGTLNGILKRCYSFIDQDKKWHRMTGYKVGNLVSQWYGQAQFAPQVVGYLEGTPPLPAENFPVGKDEDVDTYAYKLNNSISFKQAEEVSYNYSTSKEAGWNVAVESEGDTGIEIETLIAPLGFGISFEADAKLAAKSNWETSGKRSQSFERGTSVNTSRTLSVAIPGYDNGLSGPDRYYKLDNSGYALVKSKTADIYLLRLAHNNALVSISWQPNPDIPEDVNIIPFPINPLYIKQGTLDGKFSETTDDHYPQAQGAYGQYSYFKPREAYQLKKQIDREKMELEAYFEDSFDVAKTNAHFQAAAATTGISQLAALYPAAGPLISSLINQTLGQIATQVAYNSTTLKDDLAKMGSQRNLVNTYVWTIEGGFYAESTEVAETLQETFANETSLSLGGGLGVAYKLTTGASFEQKTLLSSGSSFTLTKSKTKASSTSFGLDLNVDIPTSARYKYGGVDGRTLTTGLINPGTVDAYRFMSFYLEPKGKNFIDLFTEVIDPIWLEESPDPNAQALRQARGSIDRAKPCWRIMHRVTYVSRVLPEFQPEAPPSLEKSMRISGIESNYMLIKKFEPYLAHISDSGTFFEKIEEIIDSQLIEFAGYKQQIKHYLALYFNIDQA